MIFKNTKTVFSTEILVQILSTLVLSILIIYCEFVLGESVFLNKAVYLALPVLFSVPAVLMFKDLGLFKVHTLFFTLVCQIICLIFVFNSRQKMLLVYSASKNVNYKMIKRFINEFQDNPSLMILMIGSHISDEFIQAVSDRKLENSFIPYLMANESIIKKIKAVLKGKNYTNLTGYANKLLVIYETNDNTVIEDLKKQFKLETS